MMKIGGVIVTYNRLDKLKKTLRLFDEQIYSPQYLIVVNNASTDYTKEYLKIWSKADTKFEKIVINVERNTGGSGGFYIGLNEAKTRDAEWIWVSDDDAFPENDALDEANKYLKKHLSELGSISAICGTVINNGVIDCIHRRNMIRKGIRVVDEVIPIDAYKKEGFEINCFSYVGVLINKEKLCEVGMTNKDYFLWWDDTEHSLRLSKVGKIICVPKIKIHHDIGTSNIGFTWKLYYNFRNLADLYRKHFSSVCYDYFCFKILFKIKIKNIIGKDKSKNQMIRSAILDARNNKLGIHPIYKPGWKQ